MTNITVGNIYSTRDKRQVTVLSDEAAGTYPIVAQTASGNLCWFTEDGASGTYGVGDILFTTTQVRYANIYASDVYEDPSLYRDLEKTRKMVTGMRGARTPKAGILKVTYTFLGDKVIDVTSEILPPKV